MMNSAGLKWLHRWLGLVLGLVLALVSLSGSWLIYERELGPAEHVLVVRPTTLPLQTLYERAMAVLPADGNVMLRFPQRAGQPYQLWSDGPEQQRVFIDPYRGEILAVRAPDYWPYGWIFELHSGLLAGESGEVVLGWLGVGFLFMTLLGIVLWLPRSWRSAWRLRLTGSRFLRHYDLHRQLGLLAAPLLLIAFVTGISLNFSGATISFLNRVSGTPAQSPPAVQAATGQPRASLDALALAAEQALPGGRISVIVLGKADEAVLVRKQLPGDPHPNGLNSIYLNPSTAAVLKTVPVAEADAGRRWFNWAYPLHTGQAFQPWQHWLMLAAGLIPPLLFVTGLVMYLLRRSVRSRKPG